MSVRDDSSRIASSIVGRTVLGRFEVLKPIARGGMGQIFLGRAIGAKGFVMPVVIKQLRPGADQEVAKMFVREANVMAGLRHPNIVQAIDFNDEGSELLLVMEYIEGYPLSKWAAFKRERKIQFDVACAVQIVQEVLAALQHAHEHRGLDGEPDAVIHRDVTPSNIMVSVGGHVKLLDFGIARVEHDKTQVDPDAPLMLKGKFAYLAPDLIRGAEPSPASDVYSAALVLYELLAGFHPFSGSDVPTTIAAVARIRPQRLDRLRSDVSRPLADVVERALSKSPESRYLTANALFNALREVCDFDPRTTRDAFVADVNRDFFDPSMVSALHGADIRTLARVLRSETTPITAHDAPEISEAGEVEIDITRASPSALANADEAVKHSIATVPSSASKPASASGQGARASAPRQWFTLALSAVALALAAVVGLRMSRAADAGGFVVVESPTAPTAPTAPTVPTVPAAPTVPVAHADDEAVPPLYHINDPHASALLPSVARVPSAAPRSAHVSLGSQFAQQTSAIRSCAQREQWLRQSSLEGVRLTVGIGGRVRAVSVLPESAASTEFGRCLQRAIMTMRFSSQSQEVQFRVPLRLRAPR